jgi:hypothetical protein
MTKRKRTNNDLQNIRQKSKDRAKQTHRKQGVNSGDQEGKAVPDSTRRVTPVINRRYDYFQLLVKIYVY